MFSRWIKEFNRHVALGLQAFFLPSIRDAIAEMEAEGRTKSLSYRYLVFVEEKVTDKVERNLDFEV